MRKKLLRGIAAMAFCFPAGAVAYDASGTAVFAALKVSVYPGETITPDMVVLMPGHQSVLGSIVTDKESVIGKMARRALLPASRSPGMRCANPMPSSRAGPFRSSSSREVSRSPASRLRWSRQHRRNHQRAQSQFRNSRARRRSCRWQFAGPVMIKGLMLAIVLAAPAVAATRIKDITLVKNVRPNQLIGYGIVVGLNGTGDTLRGSPFTSQSIQSMLDRMGINIRANTANNANPVQTKNAAAVIVTTELPPFAGEGARLDVTVSSLGNATSLPSGTLMLTPLSGADNVIYAAAQGPVSISGFSTTGRAETLTQGVPTAGRVANGALVERKLPNNLESEKTFTLELYNPDFATASRAADVINAYTLERYQGFAARAADLRSIALLRPPHLDAAQFLSEIGELPVQPDSPAKIVIDEKSGTVVIGHDVQISPVAVAHGNITVRVTETPKVVQPSPFSQGQTAVQQRTAITRGSSRRRPHHP